jgi:hypothetical protein
LKKLIKVISRVQKKHQAIRKNFENTENRTLCGVACFFSGILALRIFGPSFIISALIANNDEIIGENYAIGVI